MTDFEKKIEEFVVDIYKIKGIKFGQFQLKSGLMSPIYFDLRVIVSYPKLMVTLSELLTELMENKNVRSQTICGVPYTALPIATLVSTATNIPMVVRRKEKKDYGTGRMVEGQFAAGASCLIIEDVISTGSSILETALDLHKAGLDVKEAVVVLDREHGALANLEANGIKAHVLVSLSQLLAILFCRGHLTQQIVADVRRFVAQSQVTNNGTFTSGAPENLRTKSPFSSRSTHTQHPLAIRLFEVMTTKESLLCVAADVTSSAELLTVADEVGPHISVFKTHADAVADFDADSAEKLLQLSKKHNFLILEDRKFADIGNTVKIQMSAISRWAELVTAHSIAGPAIFDGLRKGAEPNSKGAFVVAELSSEGALTGPSYAKETLKMAEDAKDIVIGVVCQSPQLVTDPALIQLTPGVRLSESGDGMGQQYVSPRDAVLIKGADLAVVGRGILDASDRAEEAKKYRTILWEAYLERTSSGNR